MSKIEEIFGKVNYSEEDYEKEVYSGDATHIKGKPEGIVWPTNVEKIHELVQYCKRTKIGLTPRGGGTSLVGGATPLNGLVVDMSKMNKIIEINEDKGYAIVESGVILEDLNELLTKTIFPIQPGSAKACTIGGMIATNAFGLKTKEYGQVTNWLEELEVVDGTGKFLRLKKDLAQNFCGMEGTTGIIVAAKLRLLPKPRTRTISILNFNTLTAMMDKVEEELKNENIKNLIFIDETCSDILDLEEKNHLIIEYDNDDGNIKDKEEIDTVWAMLDKTRSLLMQHKLLRIEDSKIPITEMGKFLYWLKKRNIPCYGPIGAGVILTFFHKDSGEIDELHKIIKTLKGNVNYGHGLGVTRKHVMNPSIASKALVTKQAYDPENIMNRGKLI